MGGSEGELELDACLFNMSPAYRTDARWRILVSARKADLLRISIVSVSYFSRTTALEQGPLALALHPVQTIFRLKSVGSWNEQDTGLTDD